MSVRGVLLDRDGTIVVDVPYNGDPALVEPVAGAKDALDRLRAAGLRVGVLTNQSGVGRGMITSAQVRAVNERIEALLGPFDGWYVCEHGPEDGCGCRKPGTQLVEAAARAWDMPLTAIAIVGDKRSDVETARNTGGPGYRVNKNDGASLDAAVTALLSR